MVNLSETHPDVALEFNNGNFTVAKTTNQCSAMAIDQAHKQNNACVKGDGGAIGLTQNSELHQRWTVARPDVARVISEFESSM